MTDLTRDDVENLEQAHIDALLANDLDALDRLYADDILHIHYDGRRDTKEIYFAPLRKGAVKYTELRFVGDTTLHLLGDTATVTRDMFWKAEAEGEEFEGTISYTSVWTRRGDDVVQIIWHSSPALGTL